jgi:hypothetical protein
MSSQGDKKNNGHTEEQNNENLKHERGIEIPADRAYELEKIAILQELQSDIMTWAKKRFWLLFIAVSVLGIFGFTTLINQTISSRLQPLITRANEEITRAKISAENATETTNSSEKLIKEATEKVNNYSSQVTSMQDTADILSKQFSEIKRNLDAEASNIRAGSELGLNSLKERLEKLESFVETVAKESVTSKTLLTEYKASLTRLENQTQMRIKEFAEYSDYSIAISTKKPISGKAALLSDKLTKLGFKTSNAVYDVVAEISRKGNRSIKITYVNQTFEAVLPKVKSIIEEVFPGELIEHKKVEFSDSPLEVKLKEMMENMIIIDLLSL